MAGLQVQKTASGVYKYGQVPGWMEVPARGGGCAIVNIGSLMARWTNDRWKATPHRVVISNAKEATRHRHSFACFFHPDNGTVVKAHPKFLASGELPLYEPITPEEHLKMRLQLVQRSAKRES